VRAKVYVGTSGWNYKHWIGRFYPEDLPQNEMLGFYARQFDSVEINNSFYQLPKLKTFNNWRQAVPKNFTFAVKASRFITHMKKLKAPKTSSRKLFTHVKRLDHKLGPILFQLPPHWQCDIARLAAFIEAMPAKHSYVFEFRDESWFNPEVYRLLAKHNVAFCIHDFRSKESPREITADFTYLRFHGPHKAAYSGSYPPRVLEKWAKKITEWQHQLSAIHVYFNNDAEGHAIRNALSLRELLEISSTSTHQ
jgi:uncharacterized protein YecE (DUF72 family)